MKIILATEKIFNEYGDLIAVKYHYEGGGYRKIKIFISQGEYMSIPRQNTVWGKFKFDNRELGVLGGRHLNETIENTINEFMKDKKPLIHSLTAPWLNNQPHWEVEGGKLYLTYIGLSIDDNTNRMQKIFRTDRIFAEWVSVPIKLLVRESKQKPVVVYKGKQGKKTLYEVTMDVIILDFKQGVFQSSEHKEEVYRTSLKNYLEEEA